MTRDVSPAEVRNIAEDETLTELHREIAAYYTETVVRHGATPRGVDWTCQATQEMRFVQLLKVCEFGAPVSVNDLGCGYGALAGFLARRHPAADVDYLGIDVSREMIRKARRRHRGVARRRFLVGTAAPRMADYTLASGVMNVKLGYERAVWERFVVTTLVAMRRTSRRGFAVNFLREEVGVAAADGLYRTAPEPWVRFCGTALGWSAEIVGAYGMQEFTLLVRPAGRDAETRENQAPAITVAHSIAVSLRTPSRRRPRLLAQPVSEDAGVQTLRAAAATIVSPEEHAEEARVHAAFRLLRREAPVYRVEQPGIQPFWAVTRHRDVLAVERKGASFAAAPRTILSSELVETSLKQISGRPQLLRPLTHMDEPDHGPYRAVSQPWFSPPALAALAPWIARWARESVGRIAAQGGTCDFATEIAVPFSLRVITRILGIPPDDEPQLDRLLRGLVGAEDPRRRLVEPPANPVHAALLGCRDYFDALAADRRACPRADLASTIANAMVHGAPMPQFERVSYFVLVAIAGYDTTAFALSGGLHALIAHPDEIARLQREPSLLDDAIEEILRWTSPSRHFVRTATEDTVIGGQTIRAGDSVAIFFPSANRDEVVFNEPDAFRIDRAPNPHLTFGWGAHHCLGHALARLELRALLGELLGRLKSIEIAGTTRRAQSVFLTGFTSLPVHIRLA